MSNSIEVYKIKNINGIKIYINDILHLYITYKDNFSFQSYIDKDKNDNSKYMYYIEYYFDGQTIETGYENKEDWENILKQISNIVI